ncbi:ABC transporter substrate-binding protein [Halobacteriovorax sp. HLS]|uniref:substrate-binding periplasmic protein n=1 Tax=Halobacteriovorax sp. HLS TaxID=2234000 RepID=UPI000FDCA592|nr:hypothetical protein [Halobacteriovorax sp. HLS]
MKLLVILLIFISTNIVALDKIILSGDDHGKYSRRSYPIEILKLALEKTQNKYGPYSISYTLKMTRDRALSQLKSGHINVHEAPTRTQWEKATIPILIPLTKGLLGYRLFFIRSKDQKLFSNIQNIEDLKKYKPGLGSQWSTTRVLKAVKGFDIVEGSTYEGLFAMLNSGRFDFFIRGVNEIYGEALNIETTYPEISIENDLIVNIPMPLYLFVSKKTPRLAQRIEEGILLAIDDGSFDEVFNKYHKESILKANFSKRRFIHIGNPLHEISKKYQGTKYWLSVEQLKKYK